MNHSWRIGIRTAGLFPNRPDRAPSKLVRLCGWLRESRRALNGNQRQSPLTRVLRAKTRVRIARTEFCGLDHRHRASICLSWAWCARMARWVSTADGRQVAVPEATGQWARWLRHVWRSAKANHVSALHRLHALRRWDAYVVAADGDRLCWRGNGCKPIVSSPSGTIYMLSFIIATV